MPRDSQEEIRGLTSLGVAEWVTWVAAMSVAAIGVTSFVYANFQTKEQAIEVKADIVQRLIRLEDKVDKLLESR